MVRIVMNHRCSVFKNSCVNVPLDAITKMPKTAYERKHNKKKLVLQSSIDTVSTSCSVSTVDIDAGKLKDFYRSIPNYNDINHLPTEQFYSTVRALREKKKVMLELAIDNIDDCLVHLKSVDIKNNEADDTKVTGVNMSGTKYKNTKSNLNSRPRQKYYSKDVYNEKIQVNREGTNSSPLLLVTTGTGSALRKPLRKSNEAMDIKYLEDEIKPSPSISPVKENIIINRPKRNQSACSISWSDAKIENNQVDEKFDSFFNGRKYTSTIKVDIGDDFRTQSMPSSPLKVKRAGSPTRRRKSITIPKPFKMTERDEVDRKVTELRSLRKSLSDDMIHRKCERQQFRANPVPIESRIPLYDKILEDQAMRRAITKINSEAELRAQMKPFSFTKKEEKGSNICDRAVTALPQTKKKKQFRARPFPKNLFSNYFYDKLKEEQFFSNMNRRIRAEEMLKTAHIPGTMAARDRSRLSTPAAHSDLPVDPSPAGHSVASSDRRCSSPTKGRKKDKKEYFITTSPQPFRFNTADRAAKKMANVTQRIYQESKSTESIGAAASAGGGPRAYSAFDLRGTATGRSNLAALLRAEAVRRKFDMETAKRLEEHRRILEIKTRDRLLRSKPSWHLVKNNHEEDIAMRLQTRRDEERMRREEFFHEMELMYGRVQRQPMLFERFYVPRSLSIPSEPAPLSPAKKNKRRSKKHYNFHSPSRCRKVSINDTAETFNGNMAEYLNRSNDNLSDSEVAID